jgi:hypothetical protein
MCDIDEPSTAGVVKQHTNLPRLLLDQLRHLTSIVLLSTRSLHILGDSHRDYNSAQLSAAFIPSYLQPYRG